MKKYICIIGCCLLGMGFIVTSCNKELNEHKPIDHNDSLPAQIFDVSVVNQSGKATIFYTIPEDSKMSYVEAVYTMTNGDVAKEKMSYYNDSIQVKGFADTLEHVVKLYSVSHAGVRSAPKVVKVKPLPPAIWEVAQTIAVQNTFGGYNLTADNPDRDDISIIVTDKNEFGEYEIDNDKSVYTSTDSIVSKIRGLDTSNYKFGFLVMDHWGNKTDTVYKNIHPLYETQLSPDKFRAFPLHGDAPQVTNGAKLEYAWDGQLGWPWTSFTDQIAGGDGPHSVTIDLGVVAKISRVWIRPYPEGDRYYYLSAMKKFQIWGSKNPSLDGKYDDTWHLLGTYHVVKPSGLPYGTYNNDDVTTAEAGFNWETDINAPAVQYLRIKCIENFGGGTAQSINELKVYGDPR